MANEYGQESNDFMLKDFKFLPSIEVMLLDGGEVIRNKIATDPKFAKVDIWDGNREVNKEPQPKLNLDKFEQYFQMNFLGQELKNGKSRYVKTKFRKCTKKDFDDIGLKIDPALIPSYEDRFCPE